MRLFVAGPEEYIEECSRKAREAGLQVVAVSSSPLGAVDLLVQGGFDAALIGFPPGEAEALLREFRPEMPVFVSVPRVDGEVWARLAALGGSPVPAGSEVEALQGLFPRARSGPAEVPEEYAEFAQEDAAARRQAVAASRQQPVAVLKSRVFTCYSPKGGAGKTTLAVAIAQSAAKMAGLKTCIVDLDPTKEGSDVARRFGYFVLRKKKPPVTVAAWQDFPWEDARAWEAVKGRVVETDVPNLWILPAPWSVREAVVLTGGFVENVLHVLKRHFDVVVLDTSGELQESTVVALDQADIVVLVGLPNVDDLDLLAGFVHITAGKMKLPLEKIRLVFNMVPADLPYSTVDAAVKVGLPKAAEIPEDPEVRRRRNASGEVPDATSDTPFGAAVRQLLGQLFPPGVFPELEKEQRKIGLLGRLFGGFFGKRSSKGARGDGS